LNVPAPNSGTPNKPLATSTLKQVLLYQLTFLPTDLTDVNEWLGRVRVSDVGGNMVHASVTIAGAVTKSAADDGEGTKKGKQGGGIANQAQNGGGPSGQKSGYTASIYIPITPSNVVQTFVLTYPMQTGGWAPTYRITALNDAQNEVAFSPLPSDLSQIGCVSLWTELHNTSGLSWPATKTQVRLYESDASSDPFTTVGVESDVAEGATAAIFSSPTERVPALIDLKYKIDGQSVTAGTGAQPQGTITLTQPPTISAPSEVFLNKSPSLTFSTANNDAITLSDPVAPTLIHSVTLVVDVGTLQVKPGTSTLATVTPPSPALKVTISGTLDHLNASLDGLVYTPSPNQQQDDSLTVTLMNSVASQPNASAKIKVSIQNQSPAKKSLAKPATWLDHFKYAGDVWLIVKDNQNPADANDRKAPANISAGVPVLVSLDGGKFAPAKGVQTGSFQLPARMLMVQKQKLSANSSNSASDPQDVLMLDAACNGYLAVRAKQKAAFTVTQPGYNVALLTPWPADWTVQPNVPADGSPIPDPPGKLELTATEEFPHTETDFGTVTVCALLQSSDDGQAMIKALLTNATQLTVDDSNPCQKRLNAARHRIVDLVKNLVEDWPAAVANVKRRETQLNKGEQAARLGGATYGDRRQLKSLEEAYLKARNWEYELIEQFNRDIRSFCVLPSFGCGFEMKTRIGLHP
jgi:hypothetical protein